MRKVADEWYLNLEIAHIHGLNPGSARHRPDLQNPNDYSNVLMLCHAHHKAVDRNPVDFPAERMQRWKQDREDESVRLLFGSTNFELSEQFVEGAGVEGVRIRTEELELVVARLEEIHPRLAVEVRSLADSVDVLSSSRIGDSAVLEEFSTAIVQLGQYIGIMEEFTVALQNFRPQQWGDF